MSKTNILNIISVTSKLNVLFVEDNDDSRIQALKLFENYFRVVDVAIDGEDALNKYKQFRLDTNRYYDLVITDIEMPKMDGIALVKEIYKIEPKQPIIVISAYSDKKYFIDLINIGVDGFIQKPLSFEQVTDALTNFIQYIKSNSKISLGNNCIYDTESLKIICDENEINLTKNEQLFIEFLIENDSRSTTYEDIFNAIFYNDPEKLFSVDSIKGLVKRLRKKLPNDMISYDRLQGYKININNKGL